MSTSNTLLIKFLAVLYMPDTKSSRLRLVLDRSLENMISEPLPFGARSINSFVLISSFPAFIRTTVCPRRSMGFLNILSPWCNAGGSTAKVVIFTHLNLLHLFDETFNRPLLYIVWPRKTFNDYCDRKCAVLVWYLCHLKDCSGNAFRVAIQNALRQRNVPLDLKKVLSCRSIRHPIVHSCEIKRSLLICRDVVGRTGPTNVVIPKFGLSAAESLN